MSTTYMILSLRTSFTNYHVTSKISNSFLLISFIKLLNNHNDNNNNKQQQQTTTTNNNKQQQQTTTTNNKQQQQTTTNNKQLQLQTTNKNKFAPIRVQRVVFLVLCNRFVNISMASLYISCSNSLHTCYRMNNKQ